MIENGGAIRVSPAVLGRLADALMLDRQAASKLYALGIPQLGQTRLKRNLSGPDDALASIRLVAKRLWSASTETEALTIAVEAACSHFKDASLGFYIRRVDTRWEYPYLLDRGIGPQNGAFLGELAASLVPSRMDEVALYPALPQPGDVGTLGTMATTSIARDYHDGIVRHKIDHWSFIHGRVVSRDGMVGGITIKHVERRLYSEFDKAVMSQLCGLASLALGGSL